jgi:hypothetical protein
MQGYRAESNERFKIEKHIIGENKQSVWKKAAGFIAKINSGKDDITRIKLEVGKIL